MDNTSVQAMDKEVTEIIVKYDDGTEEVITKGIAVEYDPGEAETEEIKINMFMAKISGSDLISIAYGFGQLLVGRE